MGPNVFVQPEACECQNPSSYCDRVILESRKGYFHGRLLITDEIIGEGESAPDDWDLSLFRCPRPSDQYEKTTMVDKIQTLELVFQNESGMKTVPSI